MLFCFARVYVFVVRVNHSIDLFMMTILPIIAGSSTDTDEDDDEDDEDETTTSSSHTQTTTKYLTHMADDSATALFISNEQGVVYITVQVV